MNLSDYDVQRISSAIVRKLTSDERFLKNLAKLMPKEERMLTSAQAAQKLGISRYTLCKIAGYIGGIKGEGKSTHWLFVEDGLIERYEKYKSIRG